MKLATIDVGTNSVQLFIAEVRADGTVSPVAKERRGVQLGAGGMSRGVLTDEAMGRGIDALRDFAALCESHGVEAVAAAATSAVREAANGEAFVRRVEAETGLRVRVISGVEEARLIYLGARSSLDFSRGRVLLFDLGGGSCEIALCDANGPVDLHSVPIGHLRLSEAFHREDPIAAREVSAIRAEIAKHLEPIRARIRPEDAGMIVGQGSVAKALARMGTLGRGETMPNREHGLVLEKKDLDRLLKAFRDLPARQHAQIPGFEAKRRTLPTGAIIVRELMAAFGKSEIVTSDRSLRDGLVVDWILTHRPELALAEAFSDPRERSVALAAQRYGHDEGHAQQVEHLALTLFDALASLHRLRIDDRRLLAFAARLHDIGHHIHEVDHHRHGQYLIENIRMDGFVAREVAVLANTVRYHRGSSPKASHAPYQGLSGDDKERVRKLGGLLRLADALDASHRQFVRSLDVSVEPTTIRIDVHIRTGGDLEHWAAAARRDLLEEALGRSVALRFIADGGLPD